jgi:hypothetical protein
MYHMPTIEIDDKTMAFLEELQSKFEMKGHSEIEFRSNVVRHGILSVSKVLEASEQEVILILPADGPNFGG